MPDTTELLIIPSPVPLLPFLLETSRSEDLERNFGLRGATEGVVVAVAVVWMFESMLAEERLDPAILENPYADCARMRLLDKGEGESEACL